MCSGMSAAGADVYGVEADGRALSQRAVEGVAQVEEPGRASRCAWSARKSGANLARPEDTTAGSGMMQALNRARP